MENKTEQKQAKKIEDKKLSEKELKNTKGGGVTVFFSWGSNASGSNGDDSSS